MKNKKAVVGLCIFILVCLVFAVWLSMLPTSPNKQALPSNSTVGLGEQGFLAASTTVGVSKDAYDAYFKATSANDAVGYYQLKESGQIFDLTVKTKVLVLSSSWGYDEIRFLDGVHVGQTAWVGYETISQNHL